MFGIKTLEIAVVVSFNFVCEATTSTWCVCRHSLTTRNRCWKQRSAHALTNKSSRCRNSCSQFPCTCCNRSHILAIHQEVGAVREDGAFSRRCADMTVLMACRICDPEVGAVVCVVCVVCVGCMRGVGVAGGALAFVPGHAMLLLKPACIRLCSAYTLPAAPSALFTAGRRGRPVVGAQGSCVPLSNCRSCFQVPGMPSCSPHHPLLRTFLLPLPFPPLCLLQVGVGRKPFYLQVLVLGRHSRFPHKTSPQPVLHPCRSLCLACCRLVLKAEHLSTCRSWL